MWFKEKLEAAWYELIAPEKQELFSESNILQNNSIKNSPIQWAIINLNKKINQSKTWKERYILEKQIKQLIKLQKLYREYIKTNITNNTKKEINQIFLSIKNQIELQKNNKLSNDYQIINSKLKKEKQQLKDTIDIFSYWTIRDLVEDNIDIIWIRESISPQKYQDFFDMITIEYINFLEKIQKEKYNYKNILKQKWFLLTKKQLQNFIYIISNKTKYNFSFTINIIENNKIKKYTIDLKLFKKEKDNEKKEENKEIDVNQLFKETIFSKNDIKTKKRKIKVDNYEKLSTKEKMKKIEEILNNPQNEKFLLAVINKLENKIISVNHKKIKLSKEFINKHKIEFLNNFKKIILMIIHIESDWNYKAKNIQKSSWKWLGQWLDWNWHFSTEYFYKRKWYTKYKIDKFKKEKKLKININNLKKRKAWNTSSFETSLKNIYFNYPDKLLNTLNFNIPKNYNKKLKISPIDLTLEQQIQLLILDIWSNTKKVKNKLWQKVWIKDYIWTALLWNIWAVKEIYKIFHHTKPDIKTLNRIKNISPQYTKNLIKLYN